MERTKATSFVKQTKGYQKLSQQLERSTQMDMQESDADEGEEQDVIDGQPGQCLKEHLILV